MKVQLENTEKPKIDKSATEFDMFMKFKAWYEGGKAENRDVINDDSFGSAAKPKEHSTPIEVEQPRPVTITRVIPALAKKQPPTNTVIRTISARPAKSSSTNNK